MSKFYVLLNLKRDGKNYASGDSVEIDNKKASAHLLDAGVISKGAPEDDEKEDGGGDDGDQYDKMDGSALKEELTKRELGVSGKVDELRDRLREDDEKEEGDED